MQERRDQLKIACIAAAAAVLSGRDSPAKPIAEAVVELAAEIYDRWNVLERHRRQDVVEW